VVRFAVLLHHHRFRIGMKVMAGKMKLTMAIGDEVSKIKMSKVECLAARVFAVIWAL